MIQYNVQEKYSKEVDRNEKQCDNFLQTDRQTDRGSSVFLCTIK